MILSTLKIIPKQQIEHLTHLLCILRHYLYKSAAFGIHGCHPHHIGVVLTETLTAVYAHSRPAKAFNYLCLFSVGIGKVGFSLHSIA